MVFGLTDEGFIKKRLPDIQSELEDKFRTAFGTEINLLPTSIFGQVIGIFSEREALLWELLEEIYNSAFPDTASGVSLDNAVALTGIKRLPATYSFVTARAFGTLGITIPAGTLFSVLNVPTSQFIAIIDGLIANGINEIQKIAFDAVPASGNWSITFDGQTTALLAFDADAAAIQAALIALSNITDVNVTGSYALGFTVEFDGVDGEQDQPLFTTANTLQDGGANPITITVTEETKGFPPFADIVCRATQLGAIAAPAGSLTVIDTPIFGMDSVTNLEDADVGQERETDSELRLRRLESLAVVGTATVEGILSTIRNLEGVSSAFVIENTGDVADGEGRPPHSFEVFVKGGDNDVIREAIWNTKPAGIETYGNISGTVEDSQGFIHTIKFSRPADTDIYMIVDIVKNTDVGEIGGVYPANGDTLVRDAILAYGNTFEVGQDVVVPRFYTPINTIPGVLGITIKVGIAPNPTLSNNIAISATNIASFDASRLTVTSV